MVPPKVWKLLDTVECEDVYQFLGVDRDASLEDLRAAAEKKYASIHNQGARHDVARAGAELAGLCKSDLFRDARSKAEYDELAGSRETEQQQQQQPQTEATAAATAAAAAATAAGVAADYAVRYSRAISAAGIVLTVLGVALADGFGLAPGASIATLGVMVFPWGFAAFLYQKSIRSIIVAGATGFLLVVLGIVAEGSGYSPSGLPNSRLPGGVVLLSGIAAFSFKKSWHLTVIDTARPIAGWWMALSATWHPLIRWGATGVALGIVLQVPAIVLGVLLGGAGVVGTLVVILFLGGMILIAAGFGWWLLVARPRDVLECQSCKGRMTRRAFQQGSSFGLVCPACGSDLRPSETGRRQW